MAKVVYVCYTTHRRRSPPFTLKLDTLLERRPLQLEVGFHSVLQQADAEERGNHGLTRRQDPLASAVGRGSNKCTFRNHDQNQLIQ